MGTNPIQTLMLAVEWILLHMEGEARTFIGAVVLVQCTVEVDAGNVECGECSTHHVKGNLSQTLIQWPGPVKLLDSAELHCMRYVLFLQSCLQSQVFMTMWMQHKKMWVGDAYI